ncbi:hypothetical protein STEG23_014873, partial [Scotinomys teguina]
PCDQLWLRSNNATGRQPAGEARELVPEAGSESRAVGFQEWSSCIAFLREG